MAKQPKTTVSRINPTLASAQASHPIEIATLTGFDEQGHPQVQWLENQYPIAAITQVGINSEDIGKQCSIAFIGGDSARPLIMGLLVSPTPPQEETPQTLQLSGLDIDSDSALVLRSDEAIILETGKSRIELYPNGYINLQGVHINSQAYGPNRIKGGSVKLN